MGHVGLSSEINNELQQSPAALCGRAASFHHTVSPFGESTTRAGPSRAAWNAHRNTVEREFNGFCA